MSPGEGPSGGLRLALGGAVQSVLVTLIGAAASLGFVAFIGGAVLWARFYALGLPPDQGVAVMPRTELVSTGAAALAGFGLAGALGVAGAYLLDRNGSASRPTRFGLLLLTAAALWLIVHYAPDHRGIGYFVAAVVLATSVAIAFLAAQPPPDAPRGRRPGARARGAAGGVADPRGHGGPDHDLRPRGAGLLADLQDAVDRRLASAWRSGSTSP